MNKTVKRVLFLICLAAVLLICGGALADVQGFGKINTDKANVREGMEGPTIYQLEKGHIVYVLSSWVDKQDVKWLRFITQRRQDGTWAVRRGWLPADKIDLSTTAWTDIAAVSAGETGFLALRRNGTVTGAAKQSKKMSDFYSRIAAWQGVTEIHAGQGAFSCVLTTGAADAFGENAVQIRQGNKKVRLSTLGERRTLLYTDGTFDSDRELTWVYPEEGADLNNAVKIVQKQKSLFVLMKDGTVGLLTCEDDRYMIWGDEALPDFEEWTDVVDIDTVLWHPKDSYYYEVYCVLKSDGTVSMSPRRADMLSENWTDIVKISLGGSYVVGVKKDGTAVCAGTNSDIIDDVAEWTDIVNVSCADTYCVGLKANGTLVFAGDFEYDR